MTPGLDGDLVARVVLGTRDPAELLDRIDRLCADRLGAGLGRLVFHRTSVGSVHAVRLVDGRHAVLKLHRPTVPLAYLFVLHELRTHLADAGFPAPRPLAPPLDLGTGRVTFEALLDVGVAPDPHDPGDRDEMARGLAQLVRLCRPFLERVELRAWPAARPGSLWPEPHDLRFDFAGTAEGAEWIDALGRRALLAMRPDEGPMVVGHHDWRREHLRLHEGRLVAVYDWDSVGRLPEPVLVAGAVRTYTADWSRDQDRQYPTLEEMHAFLSAYEASRGAPFDRRERARLWAAVVYGAAYTARCEHSDDRTDFGRGPLVAPPRPLPEHSMRAFLAASGPRLLTSP